MVDSRVYPQLESFERLHISDGLAITADRWQQAHRYHRQRQNFHYQALYEPGIVYGLGVALVPDQRDGRLLQVQPGVAIDVQGNPIIVKTPEEFRIASEASEGYPVWVYLVVNYVDPDDLRRVPTAKTVQETFRLVEKRHLDSKDVELCRIQLLPDATQIQAPQNVFAPQPNQLDFRGRRTAKPYPQFTVRVGQITSDRPTDNDTFNGWSDLVRSLAGLYPSLGADPLVQTCAAKTLSRESALDCHLLYLPYHTLPNLGASGLKRLQTYLEKGSTLLIAVDFTERSLLDLLNIQHELHQGLTDAERDGDLAQTIRQLQVELNANHETIAQRLADIEQPITAIAHQLNLSLTGSGELSLDHPLRSHPFQFSQLPHHQGHPIYVKNWDGLVLMVGDLTQSWSRATTPPLPREVLRSAQEWGINLLNFAAQRHHWLQAMHPQIDSINHVSPTPDNLQSRTLP